MRIEELLPWHKSSLIMESNKIKNIVKIQVVQLREYSDQLCHP